MHYFSIMLVWSVNIYIIWKIKMSCIPLKTVIFLWIIPYFRWLLPYIMGCRVMVHSRELGGGGGGTPDFKGPG